MTFSIINIGGKSAYSYKLGEALTAKKIHVTNIMKKHSEDPNKAILEIKINFKNRLTVATAPSQCEYKDYAGKSIDARLGKDLFVEPKSGKDLFKDIVDKWLRWNSLTSNDSADTFFFSNLYILYDLFEQLLQLIGINWKEPVAEKGIITINSKTGSIIIEDLKTKKIHYFNN